MKHEMEYKGFTVSGDIVIGDWEGDQDVPYGVNYLPDYVNDLSIKLEDEELCGKEVFTEEFEERCANALIEDTK